jgi:ABC-2 type transport system permease protein
MTVAMSYADAMFATMKRDAVIWFSYRMRMVTQLLAMLFTLTMFYYVGKIVRPDAVGKNGQYFAFVVVGIVTMTVLTSALNTCELIRMELMAGTFERILISPLGPVGGVMAVAAFPILYSTVFSGLMLVLAVGIFGVPVHPAGIPEALPIAAFGAIAFACLGLLFVGGLLAFKSAMGATWVVAALSLLGGVYFPIRLFPGWIRWASEVQPFTPAVDLLRHLLVGTPSAQPIWLELVKLGGFTAVLMPGSAAVLWGAVRLARRRGTIMEY